MLKSVVKKLSVSLKEFKMKNDELIETKREKEEISREKESQHKLEINESDSSFMERKKINEDAMKL